MSTERQDQLIRKIGARGIADAPAGWQRVDLLVRIGHPHRLAIITDDTNKLEGQPAGEITPMLHELLQSMDHSWTRFRLIIDPPDSYRVWFKHDDRARDVSPEMRIAEELLFQLPPGWARAQVQSRSALVHSVTGYTYEWQPPEGLVPENAEMVMEHPFSFELTTHPR